MLSLCCSSQRKNQVGFIFNNFNLSCYNITELFDAFSVRITPHANKRINYNAYRAAKENFMRALSRSIFQKFSIN